MSVVTTVLEGRALAFVGDRGGSISAIDVTVPERPVRLHDWLGPPNAFDGVRDGVLDLALHGTDPPVLLAALGRAGVAEFMLTTLDERLEVRALHDTPGWAAGLFVDERLSPPRILVGDQKAGLRVYTWRE